MANKKILLAEDEPDIMQVLTMRLNKMGYDLIFAQNGREAVDMAKIDQPDLILMDYRLPVLNGIEACKEIKSDSSTKHIPVIFMTASSEGEAVEAIRQAGAEDCITKPFDGDEFTKKVKDLFNQKKS